MRQRFAALNAAAALVPTMLFAAPAVAQPQDGLGTVTVIHAIPDVDVDVTIDGTVAIAGFEYGDVEGPLDLPAATYEVEVLLADTDTVVLGPVDVTVAAGVNATIVAHLDHQVVGDSAPQLGVFTNRTRNTGEGMARVAVRHLADAPAVDVLTDGTVLVDAAANPDESVLTVDAGTYPITIAADADNTVVSYQEDLTFEPGMTYAIHAIGSIDDNSFQVIVQEVWPFIDLAGSVHSANIAAIAAVGVTKGCNPPANNLFCPGETVTRGEMAAFIRRALDLPASDEDAFGDDDGSVFEGDINALAAVGIARGHNGSFSPMDDMTRGQMSAFLNRAFRPGASDVDAFVDDDGSEFENDINAIAADRITRGCNPPTNDRYCPDEPVERQEMATFLARALGYN
jgi:hypothetical protein